MLAELAIHNFALVEDEIFYFIDGLNILTGETGAGKSLIIDAMGFLLGSMVRDKPLRNGAKSGYVAARFVDIPAEVKKRVEELGFEESEEGELVLSRDLKAAGRASCRINSKPATLAVVRELGGMLVDLHGQHQQYSLLKPNDHLKVLDRYIVSKQPDYEQKLNDCATWHHQVREFAKELQALHEGERARLREIDWTEHELEEIDKVSPKEGEDGVLEREIKLLAAASELRNGALGVHANLTAENGARDLLALECNELSALADKDERLLPMLNGLNEALAIIDDNIYELSNYADKVVADEAELERLQNRYEQLRTIMRKYGPEISDVLLYRQNSAKRLQELEGSSQRCGSLEHDLREVWEKREQVVAELSQIRHKYALELAADVEAELAKVGMEHCRFSVDFADNEVTVEPAVSTGLRSKFKEISAVGGDIVQFSIAPNPGEEPKPLAMIASGGEVSRIMLALLSLFSEFQKTATFFFDEIDAGLGGQAAQAVASRLKNLSKHSQVICITHLAILAVAGDRQLHLYKEISEGRTATHVSLLEGLEREQEIARMLSGSASLEQAIEHARSLLKSAENLD